MTGKQMFHTFKDAAERGPYDDYPMLPSHADPQIHLSRNDRPQPFHLICEKDCVLVQMSGTAAVHFAEGEVRYFALKAGDFVFVPAGMPHRIVPTETSIQYRYKAADPGLEGVAFFCTACETEMSRTVWDASKEVSQDRYADACESFDAKDTARTCPSCGSVNPALGFDTAGWRAVAADIKNGGA
jgi:mannose-6-phosphate isomerase-like protein (cupin superfamily)